MPSSCCMAHPPTLPNPPLKHTHPDPKPPKTDRIHPAVDTEPQETPHTVFPRKIPNYTPNGRHKHTHLGARAPKQRVRPPCYPTHHKRPTDRAADRTLFPPNHRNHAQTDDPRPTPSYHLPPRLLHSHRARVYQPPGRQVFPHIPPIPTLMKQKEATSGTSDSWEREWRLSRAEF
jgi:hypothetical protein